MGPGCETEAQSQAKANYIISLANARKDCVATVGPHRQNLVAAAGSVDFLPPSSKQPT